MLDDPRFVQATFLDATALECLLPLEDSQVTAGSDPDMSQDRPLARWQVKVRSHCIYYFNGVIDPLFTVDMFSHLADAFIHRCLHCIQIEDAKEQVEISHFVHCLRTYRIDRTLV